MTDKVVRWDDTKTSREVEVGCLGPVAALLATFILGIMIGLGIGASVGIWINL